MPQLNYPQEANAGFCSLKCGPCQAKTTPKKFLKKINNASATARLEGLKSNYNLFREMSCN